MLSAPVLDRFSIRHRHWSLAVARRNPATGATPDTFGRIVTAVADIEQSINNLVLMANGSVPTEPESK